MYKISTFKCWDFFLTCYYIYSWYITIIHNTECAHHNNYNSNFRSNFAITDNGWAVGQEPFLSSSKKTFYNIAHCVQFHMFPVGSMFINGVCCVVTLGCPPTVKQVEVHPHPPADGDIQAAETMGAWKQGKNMASEALIQYIKMSSFQYRKCHCGNKTVTRPSCFYSGISYIRMTYWIGA